MSHEREIKLLVPADFRLPVLPGLVPTGSTDAAIEQTSTYYDTPDLRLTRAGASLRFRDTDGWTVKLRVADHGATLVRAEHVFGGSPSSPPPAALELVAALVRTARLAPTARLHTVRRHYALCTPTGEPLGMLTDDLCTVLDGRVPGRFRELELELDDLASPEAAGDTIARLRAAGAAEPDPVPKVVRAMGPGATAAPDVEPYAVTAPATIDAVIRHAISDAVVKLIAHDPVVRIGDDPEGVHQARVATRRLRSHLRTFRALLEPEWTGALRDELAWLGAELGAVRDADVLLGRLRDRIDELDDDDREAAAPLLQRLIDDREAARAVLLGGLRSPRYLRLLDRLVDAARRPHVVLMVGTDHAETLRELVRAPWRHLRQAVRALADDPPDPALHEVRIRAKRARYAAEVVEPAFGRPARDLARALTGVQDVLGEHQDAVVAEAWLRAHALALPTPAATYVAGELGAMERAGAHAARADWPDAWRKADTKRLRSWL